MTRVRVNKLRAVSKELRDESKPMPANKVAGCEPMNQRVIKLTFCEAARKANYI